ncbi:MAG: hypothetical protein ACREMY_05295 [bacterium]
MNTTTDFSREAINVRLRRAIVSLTGHEASGSDVDHLIQSLAQQGLEVCEHQEEPQ